MLQRQRGLTGKDVGIHQEIRCDECGVLAKFAWGSVSGKRVPVLDGEWTVTPHKVKGPAQRYGCPKHPVKVKK